MTELIDTHAHLYDTDFESDIQDVIERAKDSGVSGIILPAIDSTYYNKMTSIGESLPGFAYRSIGLHPTSVKDNWRDELDFLLKKSDSEKFVSIGEIGMDCYWSVEHLNEQRVVFEEQLKLSSKLNLPVIIHSRDATEEIFNVLEKTRNYALKGVFHAYSGSYETFERIGKYGDFFVGIGGVVTFRNTNLTKVVERIPLERILLETDAPWLTPDPFRGKRNEPSYLVHIVKKIAEVKGCSVELVAQITTQNAKRLFRIN
ncbi:MAG: TatD family hydrolase [Bacteroidales bacterium]